MYFPHHLKLTYFHGILICELHWIHLKKFKITFKKFIRKLKHQFDNLGDFDLLFSDI